MTVRRMIHHMGFRYRLHDHGLPGRPDLIFPRLKKIVFVHGCFWHWHDGCKIAHLPGTRQDYWRPKLRGNKRRDQQNRLKLRQLGWAAMVVWECEIKDMKRLSSRLRRFLR
jgi:DNA mismatch endonuclease (patch repair protein)